jgi:hypothetical protein
MLKQFGGKNKLVAVVSDSYDTWNAIDNLWPGEKHRADVQPVWAGQSAGLLVFLAGNSVYGKVEAINSALP